MTPEEIIRETLRFPGIIVGPGMCEVALAALVALVAERDDAHRRRWQEGRALSKAREVALVAERDEALARAACQLEASMRLKSEWVAERDALAARLAEAERQASNDRAELRYWRQKRDEARETAEARVAALTTRLEELRDVPEAMDSCVEYMEQAERHGLNAWSVAATTVKAHCVVTAEDVRAALAAADRPEGTTP